MNEIRFYSSRKENGYLSNLSQHPINLEGKVWPTAEHYFQAKKFPSEPKYQEEIRNSKTPHEAMEMGRDKRHPLRSDWEEVKDDVMRYVVSQKFFEHKDIRSFLISTEDKMIIEAAPNDYYWGEGIEKTGKNMLGKILMEVRDVFRKPEDHVKNLENQNISPFDSYQNSVLEKLKKTP